MSDALRWDPDTYLETIRAEVPRFDELEDAAIAAVPFPPDSVLDLGIGTGETSRRLLAAHPRARVTGLDSSPDMVFRARELGIDAKLGRIEDPLPDGPWDLVISVLSLGELPADGRDDLFRRVREQARSLIIADIGAADLAQECGGEVVWQADDLAVVRATY